MEEQVNYMSQMFLDEGFTFSELQERQFYTFYKKLVEKNKVMNLTGITEFQDVVVKHFLDSLLLHRALPIGQLKRIIDLGTGAGFPGIPLKIAIPEIKITLVDSLKKRTIFLKEAVEELKLDSVEVIHARAEDLARDPNYREKFDLCVSRAVANLSVLEEYCLPFVEIGGKFAAYKSGEIDDEVKGAKKACHLLGGKCKEVYRCDLKGNQRSFVVVEKIKRTPKCYPRRAGMPGKEPLS